MGIFRKRKKKDSIKENNGYAFKFERYGDLPEEYIIFAGSDNEEIQKNETIWLSWDIVVSLIKNPTQLEKFANEITFAVENYAEAEVKRRLGI